MVQDGFFRYSAIAAVKQRLTSTAAKPPDPDQAGFFRAPLSSSAGKAHEYSQFEQVVQDTIKGLQRLAQAMVKMQAYRCQGESVACYGSLAAEISQVADRLVQSQRVQPATEDRPTRGASAP